MAGLPVLYSFRRCPYAIRARLGLRAAGFQPGVSVELREVDLACRPAELLELSPKGTVPVLALPGGAVLEESLAILDWALQQHDPYQWRLAASAEPTTAALASALLAEADGPLKHHLDRCRYPERFGVRDPEVHRRQLLQLLRAWSRRLERGGWLLGSHASLVDIAALPFVRQFRLGDPERFDAEPDLGALQHWLGRFLASPELAAVMEPPWGLRQAWLSPRWLYHLALRQEWRQACRDGVYRRSTRGLSLEQVGFIHASFSHQVPGSFERFFQDAGPVLLLTIDPEGLRRSGVPVRLAPTPESGELFPHLQGPLPLEAVLRASRYPAGQPAPV
jgi:glutathione S-transferase